MIRAFVTMGLTFLASAAFADGPFGIAPGAALESLKIEREISTGRYVIEVPNRHPEFEFYIVTATPAAGVCSVSGIGKDHDNDRFGIDVREAFSTLREQLERRYGQGEEIMFLRRGALWDSSDEWVMSIRQNERAHQMSWENVVQSVVGSEINDILLTVNANSSSSSYVTLQYRFLNIEACRAEIDQTSEDAL
jgi:hypothetical protein